MFDARKLLDAFVGAAAQAIPSSGRQAAGPQPPSGQGEDPAPMPQQGGSTIAGRVDQSLRQVTGQGADQLVQKAKDVMAQNPVVAPAVMVALAGLFSASRRSSGISGRGLAKLGGLALVGTLAYKAYQNRQSGKPLLDAGGGVAGGSGDPGQGQPEPEPARCHSGGIPLPPGVPDGG